MQFLPRTVQPLLASQTTSRPAPQPISMHVKGSLQKQREAEADTSRKDKTGIGLDIGNRQEDMAKA